MKGMVRNHGESGFTSTRSGHTAEETITEISIGMRPHTHTKLLCLNFSEEKTFGIKNMKLFKKDQEIGLVQ